MVRARLTGLRPANIQGLRLVCAVVSAVIVVLPLAAVGALGYSAFRTLWGLWSPTLPEIVSVEATRLLGVRVSVGELIVRSSELVAADVSVQDPTRPSGPPLARAAHVAVALPENILERLRSSDRPVVDTITVRGGDASVVRDRGGRWNFAELFKPGKARPARAWIGRVEVSELRVRYEDHALPRRSDRPDAALRVTGRVPSGTLLLDDPGWVAWSADAALTGAHQGRLMCTGSYDGERGALLTTVNARDVNYPTWCNRFLPKGYDAYAGRVSGRVSIGWLRGSPGIRLYGQAEASNARIGTPLLRRIATVHRASVSFDEDHVSGSLQAVAGGVRGTLAGRVDGFTNPRYTVRLDVPSIELRDALYEIPALASYRSHLAGVRGRASVRGAILGGAGRATVRAVVDGRAFGRVTDAVTVHGPADIRLFVAGPLQRPGVWGDAHAAHVMVQGTAFYAVQVRANLSGDRAMFSGSGAVAGGRWNATGHVMMREPLDYAVRGSVRSADLSRLSRAIRRALERGRGQAAGQTDAGGLRVSGVGSADVDVTGTRSDPLKSARAIVQVSALNLNSLDLDEAAVAARIESGSLMIDTAQISRGAATATASGFVRLSDWTGTIKAEADDWPIAALFGWADVEPPVPVAGMLSLRDVRLDGDLRRPHLRGGLFARGLQVDTWDIDYGVAAVEGTADAVTVDGELIRVPSVVTINGMLRRPFSGSPWVTALAHGRDVDIADVLQILGARVEVSGLAEADAVVHSPASRIGNITFSAGMDRLWAADVVLEGLRVEGRTAASADGIAVRIAEASARLGDGTLSGQANLEADGTFGADLRATSVPLDAVSSLTSGYADLDGTVDVRLRGTGHRDADGGSALSGDLTLNTRGLRLNGEDLGDVAARLSTHEGIVTGERSSHPAPALRWGSEEHALTVDRLAYNLETGQFDATVKLDRLPIDALRRAVKRSPAVVSGGGSDAAVRLLAALSPLEGYLSASGPVSGTPEAWRAEVDFDGSGLAAGAFRADRLVGSLVARNDRIVLTTAEMQTGDAVLSAEGELVPGERVRGTVTAQGIDLSLLEQWLPGDSPLRGLRGKVDTVSAEVSGKPDAPEVALFVAARDVALAAGQATGTQAVPISAPAVRLSGATIREGEMGFDDLAIVFQGVSAQPGLVQTRPAELHASGRIPFSWQSPFIASDAVGELRIRMPETDLQSLLSLSPTSSLDIAGSTGGELAVRATREDLEQLASGEPEGPVNVDLNGELWLKAERIRALNMRTALSDVQLRLRIADKRLTLEQSGDGAPAARIVSLGLRSDVPVETGEVRISGSLPISEPGAPDERITVSIPRMTFDEAPFPGFSTGRFAGEVVGWAPYNAGQAAEPGPAEITVGGTLMQPHISGAATLRKASMRLPITEAPARAKRPVPAINPTFDVKLAVEDGAQVRANQLNAFLGTPNGRPLHLSGSLAEPQFTGTLTISAGTLTFPTARFTINRGGLVSMRYPAAGTLGTDEAGFDVSVDLSAQARVSAESVTGRLRRYLVTVEARGPLMEPPDALGTGQSRLKLTYRADPPDLALSNEGLSRRITALLGGQDALNAVFGNQRDAGGVLMGKVVDYLGGALMPDLVDQTGVGKALGLSEFSVDYSRAGAFILRLSRDLPGPFEIGYWKHISGARMALAEVGDWELRLGARLQKRVRLTWTVNDQRTNVYRLEGVYSF